MDTSKPQVWTVRETRVDYVSLTARSHQRRSTLGAAGRTLIVTEQRQGNDIRPFTWMGYHGLSCGSVSVGDRDDGTILRLAGDVAAAHWRTAAMAYDNCTRIDLAVTARPYPRVHDLAEREWERAYSAIAAGVSHGLCSLWRDNKGGQTCYVGSRSSDRFARLYNKESESGETEYEGCWRWEIEYKGGVAPKLIQQLLGSDDPMRLARGTVHQHWKARGAEPPWSAEGPAAATSLKRALDDNAVRLRWLRSQVAPSVARLWDAGLRKEALEALGLRFMEVEATRDAPTASEAIDGQAGR